MGETKTLLVCGAGIMGHGIAQLGAMAGLEVRLVDVSEDALEAGYERVRESLARLVDKGKLEAAAATRAAGRITLGTDLAAAAEGVGVVIEAVPEVLELKLAVFATLDAAAPRHALLATNTSQFSITAIASATTRPGQVVGMHFFSPAVVMKLVEVVRGLETSDETVEAALALARSMGKEPVLCRRDSPGFITTRILAALTNEAQRIVEEGLASPEEVDKACRLAFGHPMGPFETADLTGLDTQLRAREALAAAHGERFRPTNLLRTLVAAGRLGRKSGKGFYPYD